MVKKATEKQIKYIKSFFTPEYEQLIKSVLNIENWDNLTSDDASKIIDLFTTAKKAGFHFKSDEFWKESIVEFLGMFDEIEKQRNKQISEEAKYDLALRIVISLYIDLKRKRRKW